MDYAAKLIKISEKIVYHRSIQVTNTMLYLALEQIRTHHQRRQKLPNVTKEKDKLSNELEEDLHACVL